MPKSKVIKLKISDFHDLTRKIVDNVSGNSYSQADILDALFKQHEYIAAEHKRVAFTAKEEYQITLPDNKNPNLQINYILDLPKDLIRRESHGRNEKIPNIIFKPIRINGKRYLQPSIAYRPSINSSGEVRYSVVPKGSSIKAIGLRPLGSGSYGSVYLVEGTIAPHRQLRWIYKDHKERIIKVMDSVEAAAEESRVLEDLPLLHAKPVTFDEKSKKSYLVEKRAQGIKLESLLEDKAQPLTVDERYQLTINLLQALQEFHNTGRLHLDIKPANILVDRETLAVTIIDVGGALKVSSQNNPNSAKLQFTWQYVAKEMVAGDDNKKPLDERADIYSMALVLNEVWGGKCRTGSMFNLAMHFNKIEKAKNGPHPLNNEDFKERGLFSDLNLLDQQQKNSIESILSDMTQDKDLRENLINAGERFNQLRLRNLSKNNEVAFEAVNDSYQAAMNAKHELKKLTNPDAYLIEDLAALQAQCRSIPIRNTHQEEILAKAEMAFSRFQLVAEMYQELDEKQKEPNDSLTEELSRTIDVVHKAYFELQDAFNIKKLQSPANIVKIITDGLAHIDESNAAVQEFINTVEISAFRKCTSKKDIQSTMDNILMFAANNRSKLMLLKKEVLTTQLASNDYTNEKESLLKELDDLERKYSRNDLSIDEMNLLNQRTSILSESLSAKIDLFAEKNKSLPICDQLASLRAHALESINIAKAFNSVSQCQLIEYELSDRLRVINGLLANYEGLNGVKQLKAWNQKSQNILDDLIKDIHSQSEALINLKALKPYYELKNDIKMVKTSLSHSSALNIYKAKLLNKIEVYITESPDRASSDERTSDIDKFLGILTKYNDKADLNKALKVYFSQIQTGIEKSGFGAVFSLINEAAPDLKTGMFGKKIFRSKLRDSLKEVVDEDEKLTTAKEKP